MKDILNKLDPLSRRVFAERTAKAALGLSVIPAMDRVMGATSGKAKHVIYLYMSGGMTHIDTFDPKPGSDTQGNTKVIDTKSGYQMGEYFKGLAERSEDIAVVRSLNQKTGAHDGGRYTMQTSYTKRATIVHPNMGAWGQKLLGKMHPQIPDSVTIGGGVYPGSGFMGPQYSPLPIGSAERGLANAMSPVDGARSEKRMEALDTFNRGFLDKFKSDEVKAYTEFYDGTLSFLQSDGLDVFDLTKEPKEKRDMYGNGRFGQSLLLARRLVEDGVRYVQVSFGGWDMHNQIDGAISTRGSELDRGVSNLIDDLKACGKWEDTLIVLTTEFGRTPNINANAGRDHHPRCFSGMLAGGGIKGGQVYGKTDSKGYAVEEDPCTPQDFNATIATAMGMPLDKVVFAPSGRPFLLAGHTQDPKTGKILSEGKPIQSFFG